MNKANIRKIVINILLAFIAIPLLFFIKDLVVIKKEYYPPELDRGSISDFVFILFKKYINSTMPLLFLLLIFLTFQLIKDYYYKKGKVFCFLYKVGILRGIVASIILFFGSFNNIWVSIWW